MGSTPTVCAKLKNMILNKQVSKEDFYKSYYTALNGILNLSNKQLDVLSEFSIIRNNLPDNFTDEQKDEYTFSSTSRNVICEKLGISIYNLNNYIKGLKEKGMIVSKNGDYTLNRMIFIPVQEGSNSEIIFRFNIK